VGDKNAEAEQETGEVLAAQAEAAAGIERLLDIIAALRHPYPDKKQREFAVICAAQFAPHMFQRYSQNLKRPSPEIA